MPLMKKPAANVKKLAVGKSKSAHAPPASSKRTSTTSVLKKPAASPAASVLKKPAGIAAPAANKRVSTAANKRVSTAAKSAVREPSPTKKVFQQAQTKGSGEILSKLTALMVGLARRPDRRQRCEEMLKQQVPWLTCSFFNGTDGKNDHIPDNEVAKTWNTRHNALYGAYEDVFDKQGKVIHKASDFENPGVEYAFSPGERGCAHSHYRIWRQVAEGDVPILIIEDDVQLVFERSCGGMSNGVSFANRLEEGLLEAEKKEADVLYLGWSGFRDGNFKHHSSARGRKSPILRKAEYVWTTVAYVLWPKGAHKLLEAAQPMNQPVDNFMAWECREGRLDAYVILDDGDEDDTWSGGIVTQFDFNNDSDVRKSDGGDQGHDPTEYLASKSEAMQAEDDKTEACDQSAPAAEGGAEEPAQPEEEADMQEEDAEDEQQQEMEEEEEQQQMEEDGGEEAAAADIPQQQQPAQQHQQKHQLDPWGQAGGAYGQHHAYGQAAVDQYHQGDAAYGDVDAD